MRERVVPIFERYKVDLVLSGHSHSYERSYLLNGHYGQENTFVAGTHALSGSNAKYDGSANSCTYIKNAGDMRNGIVYAVVGSSGQVSGSTTGYYFNRYPLIFLIFPGVSYKNEVLAYLTTKTNMV